MKIGVFVLSKERGGGQVENFAWDPLILGRFYQEEGDRGRVWGLAENFDKDLLVLGHGSSGHSCK